MGAHLLALVLSGSHYSVLQSKLPGIALIPNPLLKCELLEGVYHAGRCKTNPVSTWLLLSGCMLVIFGSMALWELLHSQQVEVPVQSLKASTGYNVTMSSNDVYPCGKTVLV